MNFPCCPQLEAVGEAALEVDVVTERAVDKVVLELIPLWENPISDPSEIDVETCSLNVAVVGWLK